MDLGFLVHFTRWLYEAAPEMSLSALVKLTAFVKNLDAILNIGV